MPTKKMVSEYPKGVPPVGGINFEVGLQTLFALSGCQFFENANWRISNENQLAGKFDDLVFESDQGDILLQAKIKQNKKLTKNHFWSDNPSNADFSLAKYILSYKTIKNFNITFLALCTNSDVPLSVFNLEKNEDTLITKIFGDCKFYSIDMKYSDEIKKIIKKFKDNINPKQHDAQMLHWKNFDVTEADIKLFISKFLCIKVSERQIKTLIQEKLEHVKQYSSVSTYEYVIDRVREWYTMDTTKATYLNKVQIKLILYGEESRNATKKILSVPLSFKSFYDFDSYKILCVRAKEEHDLYLTKIIKGLRKLYENKPEDMFHNEILFASRFEVVNEVIDCLKVNKLKFLVICLTKMTEQQAVDLYVKVRNVLSKYSNKKVIIVSRHSLFVDENTKVIDEPIDFNMLEENSKQKILTTEIVFQGKTVRFDDLINSCNSKEILSVIDESVIKTLIKEEKYLIGDNIKNVCSVEPYYIKRNLSNELEIFSEEEMLENIRRKIVVLSGPPGAGKTTFLKKLVQKLTNFVRKEEMFVKRTWIINLDLTKTIGYLENRGDCSRFLDLICNSENIKTPFEIELIKSIDKFIIIDGIDETCSRYIEQLQMLLVDNLNLNISTVVIGTRNYDFILEKLRAMPNLEIIALEPFSEENQLHFFKKYVHWKRKEEIDINIVESLFNKLRLFTPGIKNFCSTPFSIKLLVEILLGNTEDSKTITDAFSKEMSIYEFYRYFLEEKKKVFVKEESKENWKVRTFLTETFDGYINLLRILAARKCFSNNLLDCFDTEKRLNFSLSLLNVGVLEQVNDTFNFIHKSFEEYFAAEYIWMVLLQKKTNSILFLTLLNDIVLNYQYAGVCDFLNGIIAAVTSDEADVISDLSKEFSCILNQIEWNEHKNITSLAFQGYINIVKLVFDKYEHFSDIINVSGPSGATALHLSAHFPDFVKYLIEKGADVNCSDENNFTIFHYIIMMCWDSDKYKIYFNMIFDKMKTSKHIKSITFYNEYAKLLRRDPSRYRGDVNINEILDLIKHLQMRGLNLHTRDVDGDTVIHWVAQANLIKIMKYLIEDCKIDPKAVDIYGNTPLHDATENDSVETLRYLETTGLNRNLLNKDGDTVLHRAARGNAINALKYLIEDCKMDPTLIDKYGNTPVHDAAGKGSFEALKYLEGRGLCLHAVNFNNKTLIHKAVLSNAVNVLKYLIEDCKVDMNICDKLGNTPLHKAAESNAVESIKYLQNRGSSLLAVNYDKDTIVHSAARGNAVNALKYFIEDCKMDPTIPDKYGNISLHDAAEKGSLEALKYLERKGLHLGVLNFNNQTLVHKAALGNAVNTLKYLIEDCKLDVNISDNLGNTPLHKAAEKNAVKAIKYLQTQSPSLLDLNNDGDTLIHRAARGNALQALKYLIEECKMNPTILDKYGNSPVHDAAEKNSFETLKYLVIKGLRLDVLNLKNHTLIYKAAMGNAINVLKYLIEDCKLDMNICDIFGNTPLHIAAERNSVEAIKYFQTLGFSLLVLNDDGATILHSAAAGNALQALKYLIEDYKMDPTMPDTFGNISLHEAAENGSLEAYKYLETKVISLPKSTNTDSDKTVEYSRTRELISLVLNTDGDTVVNRAACGNALNVLRYLIEECGIDPTIPDKYGNISLHEAARKGSLEALKYLQSRGLNMQSVTFNHLTLVHKAAYGNAVDILKYLIDDCNLDITINDKFGNTPLHKAAENDSLKAIKYLQTRGLSLLNLNNAGETLLHKAAKGNAINVLKYLVEDCKLDINICDIFGNTPLHKAAETNSVEVIKYFRTLGFSLLVLNDDGETILHSAAGGNAAQALKYLIEECKVDPTIPDKFGNIPLHDAAQHGSLEALKYLQTLRLNLDVLDFNSLSLLCKIAENDICSLKRLIEDNISENNKQFYKTADKDSCDVGTYFQIQKLNLLVLNNDGDTVIHRAARGDAINVLKYLIEECKVDPTILDKYGNIPLHDAARSGSLEAFKYLQTRGIHVHAVNFNKQTVLHKAAFGNDIPMLQYLIEDCNLDINGTDKFGNIPLHVATEKDSIEAIKYLQARGSNILTTNNDGETLIHKAALGNAVNSLKYLTEECNLSINTTDNFGNTPLHKAVEKDSVEAVKYLQTRGSSVLITNNDGETLIHKAALGNAVNSLKYLTEECNSSINTTDNFGNTPLHKAAEKDSVEAVKYLQTRGSSILITNNDGETLIHKAALGNAVNSLKYLTEECNSSINTTDNFGNTPLHKAVEKDSVEAVKYLQTRGSSILITNNDGETLIHKAALGNAVNSLKYFIEECNLDTNITDNFGNSPLHKASENNSVNAIKYLQARGLSPLVVNNDGETLVHKATVGNTTNSLKYFQEDCNLDINIPDKFKNRPLYKVAEEEI